MTTVTPTHLRLAAQAITRAGAYDRWLTAWTDPSHRDATLTVWANQIAIHGLTAEQLAHGVDRAYAGPTLPKNPIGAIVTEARQWRNAETLRNQARHIALGATPATTTQRRAHMDHIRTILKNVRTKNT